MLVSMKVDYGVRMLVHLAGNKEQNYYVPATAIASVQHVPEPFLLRIAADLGRAGLITSRRGKAGGYRLAHDPANITVADVVYSLNGTLAPVGCVDDDDQCRLSPACAQRSMWSNVEEVIIDHLKTVSIANLAEQQNDLAKIHTKMPQSAGAEVRGEVKQNAK